MTTTMTIVDYCDANNIKWFPINLQFQDTVQPLPDGTMKKKKVLQPTNHKSYKHIKTDKKTGKLYDSFMPETTDFVNCSDEVLRERQRLFKDQCEYIAMDTRSIYHIDIDTPKYDDVYDMIADISPYFKSTTKSYGKHILVKQPSGLGLEEHYKPQDKEILNNEIDGKHYDKEGDVELLCGLWSYAPRDGIMINASKEVQNLFLPDHLYHKPCEHQKKLTCENIVTSDTQYDKMLFELGLNGGLLTKASSEYNKWRNVGYILKNTFGDEEGWKLYDTFSQLTTKINYNKSDNKTFWDNIDDTPSNPLRMGTLVQMMSDVDADKLKDIQRQVAAARNSLPTGVCQINMDNLIVAQNVAPVEEVDEGDDKAITKRFNEMDTIEDIPTTMETGPSKTTEIRYAKDDNKAVELLLPEIKKVLIPAKDGRLFLKRNRIWKHDNNDINDYILAYVLDSNIYKKKEDSKVAYAQNVKNAKNIREALLTKIRTQEETVDIYHKFHSTTKGRLCFKDGVLDFVNQKFYAWNEVDFEYYTTVMIDRNFSEYFKKPDRETINLIKTNIFDILFGNDIKLALNFLSRAIAGHYEDKIWGSYLGNRNCGKGIIYELLKSSLEEYVDTIDIMNLMGERTAQTRQNAKELYWTIDLEFVRLAISQETPKAESRLKLLPEFKKLAGGGDTITARRNYDRKDTKFNIDTTFLFMGNNSLNVDTVDMNEQRLEFNSVWQFKTQEEIDNMRNGDDVDELLISSYKIKDPKLKDLCREERYKNALIYLLFENYIEEAVVVVPKPSDTEEGEMTIRKSILENYIITKDYDNDCIICKQLHDIVSGDRQKITNELSSMGVNQKKSKKRDGTRDKLCYFGVKEKPPQEESDEEVKTVCY